MDYTEFQKFKNKIVNKKAIREFKVRNSFGVRDCYKDIRKHHWYNIGRPLKESEFYAIIRGVNDLLAEELLKGNSVTFPEGMGKLELRKFKVGVKLEGDKVKNTYPVDWGKTLQLWYEDDEARVNKTLVRNESKYVYYIKYCKFTATYENQCFYEFVVNRFVKRGLKNRIKNGEIDALW